MTVEDSKIANINSDFDFPSLKTKKLFIFVGAYGSGKSEVAVNTALVLANLNIITGVSILLADLDTINPFYRSLDAKNILNAANIKVIASQYANTNVEVPAVSGEVLSVFDRPNVKAILDIGGEDMGARIVSVLKDKIAGTDYELIMVVNMNRPFTNTLDSIIKIMRELETASGLKITGFVNNTNLLELTDPEDLLRTNCSLLEVSTIVGVPLLFASGIDSDYQEWWKNKTPDGVSFLRMVRTIKYLN